MNIVQVVMTYLRPLLESFRCGEIGFRCRECWKGEIDENLAICVFQEVPNYETMTVRSSTDVSQGVEDVQ